MLLKCRRGAAFKEAQSNVQTLHHHCICYQKYYKVVNEMHRKISSQYLNVEQEKGKRQNRVYPMDFVTYLGTP